MRRILLVEPNYKNKYPPMGLMKISRYHKMLGDQVKFVKGIDKNLEATLWDRIYVTSLFTFDFDITVETVFYYKQLVNSLDDIYVGGIMASLMPDKLAKAVGLNRRNILTGLFTDTSVVGDNNDICVDTLPLDYDILEEIPYKYPAGDNYFAYTSRGCPNHCKFCAVPILEPVFSVTNNIEQQIRQIDADFGPKQHLLMLDNNILNAPNLSEIVDSLCNAGFGKGAKYLPPTVYETVMMRYKKGDRFSFLDEKMRTFLSTFKKQIKNQTMLETFIEVCLEAEEAESYSDFLVAHDDVLRPIIEKYRSKAKRARYIDFNQGVDGRKINDYTMSQLARLAIRPLRIAFDDINLKDIYVNAVRLAYKYGVKEMSNYILFNFMDKPEDLYERLRINIELNRELDIRIFSFPMRYAPISETNRSYVGQHWKVKYLRAISAILQVTKGVVAGGIDFFYRAFGNDVEEYKEILAMPRDLIMYRNHYEENGTTQAWRKLYHKLTPEDKEELMDIVSKPLVDLPQENSTKYQDILLFYKIQYRLENKERDERQLSFKDFVDNF